jgi:hypothetical protein
MFSLIGIRRDTVMLVDLLERGNRSSSPVSIKAKPVRACEASQSIQPQAALGGIGEAGVQGWKPLIGCRFSLRVVE